MKNGVKNGVDNRIKQLREHFAMTQEQFARRIGRTNGYISNIENGYAGMSSSTVSSICSAFAVREEWLRYGTGEMWISERAIERVSEEKIGCRIRDVRKRAGLTQQEFADRVGCHRNQVSNVERGEYIPQDQFLVAVSREFKVSVDWLRTGEADERDPVDDRLIEWLRKNPEVARELRIRGGLD